MHASCSNCQWVYPVNYGGGLVAGDSVGLDITIDEDCCVMLTSQSTTKVYSSENGLTSKQTLNAVVKDGALFALVQDPVTCFANARLQQIQNFYLTSESSLIMMDWLTAGRIARDERWDFTLSQITNSIYVDNVLYFRDSVRLGNSLSLTMRENMGDYNIVACCILVGRYLDSLINEIHNELSQCSSYGTKQNKDSLVCVSKLLLPTSASQKTSIPGVVVRMASTSIPMVYAEMNRLLKPIFEVLGGNPFDGKF